MDHYIGYLATALFWCPVWPAYGQPRAQAVEVPLLSEVNLTDISITPPLPGSGILGSLPAPFSPDLRLSAVPSAAPTLSVQPVVAAPLAAPSAVSSRLSARAVQTAAPAQGRFQAVSLKAAALRADQTLADLPQRLNGSGEDAGAAGRNLEASLTGAAFSDAAPQSVPSSAFAADRALSTAKKVWNLLPASAAQNQAPLRRAVEAGDFTAARETAVQAEAEAREARGGSLGPALATAFAALKSALALPDDPEIASLRAGLAEVRRLTEAQRWPQAMERAARLEVEYLAGRLQLLEHHWAISMPMVKLKVALQALGSKVYFGRPEADSLAVRKGAADIHAWAQARRRADPAAVVGVTSPEKITLQSYSDCVVRSIWNHPLMAGLRSRLRYEDFLKEAERVTGRDIKREGLNEFDERRLLTHLGWQKTWERTPRSETELLEAVAAGQGALGALDFDMTRWQAFWNTGSFDKDFRHAVVVAAAVRERGRWWFVVVNSNRSDPQLFSFGELLMMGLKISTIQRS